MKFFSLEYWPVHVICIGMIAAAIIDWWKYKVPNKLTFPLILSGWLLGLCNNFGLEAGAGGIGAAIAGTFLGMGLLLPIYAIGGMGAGDVKMTMGFGSWIGAFFGMAQGMWIIVYAFCAGTIVGGIIALGMIAAPRQLSAERLPREGNRGRHVRRPRSGRNRRQGQSPPAALAPLALRRAALHRVSGILVLPGTLKRGVRRGTATVG